MSDSPISNYDAMRNAMELKFLEYNQPEMIKKFRLGQDEHYLYIRFVGKVYRISRSAGKVEHYCELSDTYMHADYNESMTIFDVLCYSKPDCHLAEKYVSLNDLTRMVGSAPSGQSLFAKECKFFTNKSLRLKEACESLGGIQQSVGDVSYEILLFDFLPIILQFWDADDEFEAVLKIMWDKNILDYMHYETTFFATSHLLRRLMEWCG